MSQRYVVLPRGINVGTRNRVRMADLRELLAEQGYTEIVTILQSGNILLTTDSEPADVQRTVERILEKQGVPVPCMVRTGDDIRSILRGHPLADVAEAPSRYLVTFFSAEPEPALVEELASADHGAEVLAIEGSEAFVYATEGVKQMKLSYTYLEKKLGVVATARNWNTLVKIESKL